MVIGPGAREHTISVAYERSPQVKKVVITPGNDFMALNRQKEVVVESGVALTDAQGFLAIAQKHKPDLIDVAQDDVLAAGTVDLLQANGFRVFGPTKAAARLEWDKRWSREFMQRHNIPTPQYRYFTSANPDPAKEYVRQWFEEHPEQGLFIKATGLIAGKGALPAPTLDEALAAIDTMSSFGSAGEEFLVEEGLVGEEFSYYAISDGTTYRTLKSAQDNKRIYDLDQGSQTGGIGAQAPAQVTSGHEQAIEDRQIAPVVASMAEEGNPYTGIIYLGGIVTDDGINTIEYNARWGDPECQVELPGLRNDYVDLINAAIDGRLSEVELDEDDLVRLCIVGCAKGYPGDASAAQGKEIFGLDEVAQTPNVEVYGSGIKVTDGRCYVNGGRLFGIVGSGHTVKEARDHAYAAMERISVDGNNLHYRTDIGRRDLERLL